MLSYHEMIQKRSDFESLPFKDDLTIPYLLMTTFTTSVDYLIITQSPFGFLQQKCMGLHMHLESILCPSDIYI